MLRSLVAVVAVLGGLMMPASAQDAPHGSECLAMAGTLPRATPVSLRRIAAKADTKADEVAITYAGHSTYYIDTPGGVRIATDFNGMYTTGRLPDVVTMNRARTARITRCFLIHGFPPCCMAGATTARLRGSTSGSATC